MSSLAIKTALLSVASVALISFAQESSEPLAAFDCADVQLEEVDVSKLTKAERIKLLEASLFESIDKTNNCMQKVQDSMATSMQSGANTGSGAEGDLISADNTSEGAGENTTEADTKVDQQIDEELDDNGFVKNTTEAGKGAENQSIAEQDNDKRICMQLKEDVDNQTDPEKKAQAEANLKNFSICKKYF